MVAKQEPLYTTRDSVRVRLAGKVQFQRDPAAPVDGELPDDLLRQLICDAETEVEADLRGRYAIPFRSKTRGTYEGLPDHTQRAIRMAVDMRSVLTILATDFGRGTVISGEDYAEITKANYGSFIAKLLGRDQEAAGEKIDRFRRTPPLEDLLLSESNRMADDGYRGMIINTDQSEHDAASYAAGQVNNPARSYVATTRKGIIR
jgi:hypothetical protein